MPPPGNSLKRKTLVERAGEPGRAAPAPPGTRLPSNGFFRTTSASGTVREASFASSNSSLRPSSSASTRNVSNSSYASSVGSGSRPPSVHSNRPSSAMSYSKYHKPVSAVGRPATSLEVYEEEPSEARNGGKRKGRTPSSTNPLEPPRVRPAKFRGYPSSRMNHATNWESRRCRAVSGREASLITRLEQFSLQSAHTTLSVMDRPPSPVTYYDGPAPKAESDSDMHPCVDPVIVEAPKTPSHIPKLAPKHSVPVVDSPSPKKSPKKTPKALPRFLNRETNTLVAFDTDSRLEEMEHSISQFKEKFDGATTESRSLKEMMAVYKIRSMFETTRFSLHKLTSSSNGTRSDPNTAYFE